MSKKAHNHRSKKKMKKSATPAQNGRQLWDILKTQHQSLLELLETALSPAKLLNNPAAMERLGPEDRTQLNEQMGDLEKQTIRLENNLRLIYNQHRDRNGAPKGDEDNDLLMKLANQYEQWFGDWQANLVPVLSNISDIFVRTTPADELADVREEALAEATAGDIGDMFSGEGVEVHYDSTLEIRNDQVLTHEFDVPADTVDRILEDHGIAEEVVPGDTIDEPGDVDTTHVSDEVFDGTSEAEPTESKDV